MEYLQNQTNHASDQPKFTPSVSNFNFLSCGLAGMCVIAMLTGIGCGKAATPEKPGIAKARTHLSSGDFDLAIASVDSVLETEPGDYKARLLRGETHLKADKIDEAIHDFTLARDVDPGNPDAYNFRYRAYLKKSEQFKVGTEDWIKYSELASTDRKTFYQLDPTSVAAQKAPTSPNERINKLISKPIPGMNPDELDEIRNEALSAKTFSANTSPRGRQQEGLDGQPPQDDDPYAALTKPRTIEEGDAEAQQVARDEPDTNDQLSIDRRADQTAEQRIQEHDLALDQETKDPEDTIPHGDEEEQQPPAQLPQITRNNIDAFLPPLNGPGYVFENPNPTGQFSTGIVPAPNESPNLSGFNQPNFQSGGQFSTGIVSTPASPTTGLPNRPNTRTTGFNGNQGGPTARSPAIASWNDFGATVTTGLGTPSSTAPQTGPYTGIPGRPQLGTTGIGNSRVISTALPNANVNPFNGPTGFLSQEARGQFGTQFGPYLGPQRRPGDQDEEEGGEKRRLPTRADQLKPLTTALPVAEEIRYGAPVPPNPWSSPTATQPAIKNTRQSNFGP